MAVGAAVLAALVISAWLLPAAAMAQAVDPSTTEPTTTTTSTSAPPDSTTTTGPPTTPTSSPDTTTTTTSPSTTTLPQIGQGPLPGAPSPATTVPAPAVTVPPEQLRSLLEGLQAELDQFAAIDTYRRDRVTAVNAATGAAASDTLVAQAHQAVVKATATQGAVVDQVGSSIRNLSGLAIALYVHEDVASQSVADSFNGSIEDRQVMLSILLEGGQHKVKASRQVASAATGATRVANGQLAQAEAAQAAAHRARDHGRHRPGCGSGRCPRPAGPVGRIVPIAQARPRDRPHRHRATGADRRRAGRPGSRRTGRRAATTVPHSGPGRGLHQRRTGRRGSG